MSQLKKFRETTIICVQIFVVWTGAWLQPWSQEELQWILEQLHIEACTECTECRSCRSSSRAWKREAASIADHVIASFVRWDGKRPDNDFSCCFLFLFSQEEIYVCSPQFDLIPLSRASCSFYFWRSFTANQIFKQISSKQYKRPNKEVFGFPNVPDLTN